MATIAQVTSITSTGDQTINVPSGLSGVTIVYVGIINDGDGAHTGIDGTFTFGGLTMTECLGGQVNNGNYHLSIYRLENYTGTGNQTMHYGNHGGFGTIGAAVYIVQNTPTSSAQDTFTSSNNAGAANPSDSVTTTIANDVLIEGLGDANTPTAANSQTVDVTTDTNIAIASKLAATTGSYTLGWTASSGSFVHGIVAIKGTAAPSFVPQKNRPIMQAVNRSNTF